MIILLVIILVIMIAFNVIPYENMEGGIWVGKGTDNKNPDKPSINLCQDGTKQVGEECQYIRDEGEPPSCPPGNEAKGIECWKSPPANNDWTTPGGLLYGKQCAPGTNDTGVSCIYSRMSGVPGCKEGSEKKGAECYRKPQQGWDWTTPGGLMMARLCPEGSYNNGTACSYDRGAGTIAVCGPGKEQIGAECFKPAPKGREWVSKLTVNHGKKCPPNTQTTELECLYNRGEGPLQCAPWADQLGLKCWEKPGENREWVDTTIDIRHGEVCPPGTKGTLDGENCSYSRANTSTALSCPPGKEQSNLKLCYDILPEERTWTSIDLGIHGRRCPPGTDNTGTTCAYTRADRPPNKRPCSDYGEGLEDDGSSCHRISYGRGAGKMPNKAPCSSGLNDDGTSCWEPLKCWMEGVLPKCSGGGIKTDLFSRQYCDPGEEKWGALCYPTCKAGYSPAGCCVCGASTPPGPVVAALWDRQYCNDDEEWNLTKTFCLPKPKTLKVGNDNVTFNCNKGFLCDAPLDLKTSTPTAPDRCPEGKEKGTGMFSILCYDKPKPGFECGGGPECIKTRNTKKGEFSKYDASKNRDKDKPEYYHKDGWIQYCKDGWHKEGEYCYGDPLEVNDPEDVTKKWKSTCIGGSCGFKRDTVYPKHSDFYLSGLDLCPEGKQSEEGLCYSKPKSGFRCSATYCSFENNPVWGTRDGFPDQCNSGEKLVAGFCVKEDKQPYNGTGYDCFLGFCGFGKDIKVGERSEGYEVRDNEGKIVVENGQPLKTNLAYYCKNGTSLKDGMCLEDPKLGYKCIGTVCTKPIDSHLLNAFKKPVTEEYTKQFKIPEKPLIL